MTNLNNIKEVFAKGNQNAKLELGRITYWFNLNELRINQDLDGFASNRAPLYYDNEAKFYAAVKRVLNKQN
jgi:hypothetical protein